MSWIRSKRVQVQVYPKHGGRVQVKNNGGKESILLIQDLNENDSDEYHCWLSSRYTTWKSRVPGTTLTVTGREEPRQLLIFLVLHVCFQSMLKSAVSMFTESDLQVQVFKSSTGPKLVCHSSCLQDRFPFTWYQNNTVIPEETSVSYRRPARPEIRYSCGYLQYRSDLVCEFISFSMAAIICRTSHTGDVLLLQMLRQMSR